ncbi:MAG: FAD-dependent oxidoreductase [Myxococcota bacterium]|nr:FAD-dependent oxidoreductase [Myxococcota bacterium]
MSPPSHIAVVGASLAGLRTVEALRGRGYDGRISWIGDEKHAPYDRPPLSKEILRGDWEPERTSLVRDDFGALDTDLRLGRRAVALDAAARELELEGGERVGWEGLVIATGARARRLPGAPALEGLFELRTLDDALAIRRALDGGPRVVVVGGGFIGAEVAASCRRLGLEVAVVEMLGSPLEQALGPEIGAVCAALHRDHGVELRLGTGVAAIEGAGRVERVRLDDGSSLAADVVVVGIGVVPATDWLAGSGVALDDGVVCDERCASSVPGVVAVGDVARWSNPRYGESMRVEHWTNAVEMASAAAARLLDGEAGEPFAPVPFVWSDQFDAKIQVAGRPRAGDQVRLVHGGFEERKFVALYGRAGRLVGAVAWNRARRLMDWRKALHEDLSFEQALERAAS